MISADYLVMCLGDFHGHVGMHFDAFDPVHGKYGADDENLEG